MEVGVNISSFRFKRKNTRKDEYIPFYSNFSKYKEDCNYLCENVIELITEFYNSLKIPESVDYYKKYYGSKDNSLIIVEENDRVYISFTIICGAYGLKSNITDINTNEIVYERKINNADVKDFRIMFAFEKDSKNLFVKKGVVLFQVIGSYGIKTLTIEKFKSFLSHNFNIMPFFYTISTRAAFEKLINAGNFKKINLIKNQVDAELSNAFGVNLGKEVKTYAITKVKEKKKFIDKILELAESNKEVYEIDDNYDDITVMVDINGRTKTTSIKDIRSLYIVEQLPNDVLDIDGELIIPKINQEMVNHANDYLDNIVEGDEEIE